MGRFEEVSIDWFVVGQDSNVDLSPLNGSLTFRQGNGEQAILITTIADEVCKIYFHHIVSINFFYMYRIVPILGSSSNIIIRGPHFSVLHNYLVGEYFDVSVS